MRPLRRELRCDGTDQLSVTWRAEGASQTPPRWLRRTYGTTLRVETPCNPSWELSAGANRHIYQAQLQLRLSVIAMFLLLQRITLRRPIGTSNVTGMQINQSRAPECPPMIVTYSTINQVHATRLELRESP